jgi:hypothetical protein
MSPIAQEQADAVSASRADKHALRAPSRPTPGINRGKYRYSDGPCSGVRCFAKGRGLKIAAYYIENESGASLKRPELFRLLEDSHPDDVLLIEQVDRLSRLGGKDWIRLRTELQSLQLPGRRARIFRPH